MSNHEENTTPDPPPLDSDVVMGGVSQAIKLTLGAGASVAKIMAEATAGNRPVAEPRRSGSEFDQLVHYGLATVVNVIGTIATGVNDFRQADAQPTRPQAATGPDAPSPAAPDEATPLPEIPTVPAGATLKLPLSVENPGTEPMTDMRFVCLGVQSATVADYLPLTCAHVQFDPPSLTVTPRNFEKLTTTIAVPVDTPPGRYTVTIGLGGGEFETPLPFDVLAAED
jgi:hypothetical protein